jgi:hypothetical protein
LNIEANITSEASVVKHAIEGGDETAAKRAKKVVDDCDRLQSQIHHL